MKKEKPKKFDLFIWSSLLEYISKNILPTKEHIMNVYNVSKEEADVYHSDLKRKFNEL
jgi:hypothetical protein